MKKMIFESFGDETRGEVGERLKAGREKTGLTQKEFGEFFGLISSSINTYESGKYAIGVDKLEIFARAFGLRHFQLANPAFPIPAIEKMSAPFRKYIAKINKARAEKASQNETKRAEGEKIYTTGRSKQLQGLIESGFFSRSRTAKEAFFKLNGRLKSKLLTPDQQKEVAKITATLSSGRFIKLLDKLEPSPNTAEVRFVIKDPSVIKYFDTPGGTKDLAAEDTQ